MSLPEPVDLDALGALDRSRMHVFVAGPGKGEGIAIALPGKGWILIDGAQAALGDPSLLAIVERWRSPANDPVELCLLSHPHDDHVDGFVDVVEKLSPKRIALAGTDSAPRYVDILKDAPLPTATEDELKAKRVRAAFAAIRTWEEKTKRPAEAVCRSALPIFAASSFAVHVLSPPEAELTTYLNECKKDPRNLKSNANRYSIVLRVTFGETQVILPGDLPTIVGRAVASPGWNELTTYDSTLCDHAMAKVAHHGSAEAFHADVMTSGPCDRAWVITPYNSSKLPKVASADGLPRLVGARGQVYLTAVPASKTVQATTPAPGLVPLADLQDRVTNVPFAAPFVVGAVDVTPGSAREALDCVWCVALDDRGSVVGLYRGRAALVVTR
jgi:hypothetical protein